MGIKEIRDKWGVPAKVGMRAKPKIGPNKGCIGRVRSAVGDLIHVTEQRGRTLLWACMLRPDEYEYLTEESNHGPG